MKGVNLLPPIGRSCRPKNYNYRSSEICPGDTAMLNASADFPGFLYQWNPGSLSGANVELDPNSTTTYSITGVSSLGCLPIQLIR